jgi:hypothetical protein
MRIPSARPVETEYDEKARRTPAGFLEKSRTRELLTEFPTLHTGATKQLAVLLLRHTLAALLDN